MRGQYIPDIPDGLFKEYNQFEYQFEYYIPRKMDMKRNETIRKTTLL